MAPSRPARLRVKAVVWDVYGTLLVSASGDIGQAAFSASHVLRACRAAGISIPAPHREAIAFDMLQQYKNIIHQYHARARAGGVPWPEVDIRLVWQQVFSDFSSVLSFPAIDPEQYCSVAAFVFEILSNSLWPMPGMHEVLRCLNNNGILLGIVSNAQFYTPAIMNFFLTGSACASGSVALFEPALCVYSYQLLRAKPDRFLFDRLADAARIHYDILPHDILYVGNDLRNDILPAFQAGMHTALFAGDARSLRRREDDPACTGITPDFIVTDLSQVPSALVGLPDDSS